MQRPSGRRPAGLVALLLLALHSLTACGATVQWNAMGAFVNFPFASPYPPLVLRAAEGPDPDKILVVSDVSGGSYTFSAYDVASGAVNYTFTVQLPEGENSELRTLTSGTPPGQQANNSLALLFLQLGGTVVAVDPTSGRQLWAHPTYNASTPKITGYSAPDGSGTVYLTSSFLDSSRAVPTPVSYVEALDVQTGQPRWANFTARPAASGTPTSDTAALHGVTPMPGAAVYAQGQRLYALSEATGQQLWSVVVATGAAFGGTTANVSSVTFVEAAAEGASGGLPYPQLLLQSVTFQQTRFVAYRFNGSLEAAPTAAWQNRGNQDFEGTLDDPLTRLGLQLPTASQLANAFVFWSNRTTYDQNNGGQPVFSTWLVGRSLASGEVLWARSAADSGWSQLPVSRPTVHLTVAAVATGGQALLLDAGSGQTRFQFDAAPYQPLAAGGQYSYVPVSSFANNIGQLMAVRCLGSQQPGSLCVYNGYDEPAPMSAGRRQLAARAASAAGAAAAACLLLML